MCDKASFRELKSPVRQAGELYLEYLERMQKKKQPEQPGLYSKMQEDYFR